MKRIANVPGPYLRRLHLADNLIDFDAGAVEIAASQLDEGFVGGLGGRAASGANAHYSLALRALSDGGASNGANPGRGADEARIETALLATVTCVSMIKRCAFKNWQYSIFCKLTLCVLIYGTVLYRLLTSSQMFRELDLDGNVIGNAAGRELLEALHLRKEGNMLLTVLSYREIRRGELRLIYSSLYILFKTCVAKLPKAGLKVNCRRMNATLFRDIFKLGAFLWINYRITLNSTTLIKYILVAYFEITYP